MMENPIKMDDLGVPLFSETPILYRCIIYLVALLSVAPQEEFILHGDVKPRNIFLVPAGDAFRGEE